MKTEKRHPADLVNTKLERPEWHKKRYPHYRKVSMRFAENSGRTQQHFKDECDVNNIMKKYEKTGVLPQLQGTGLYGDYSDPVDFQEALNTVNQATEQFENLPAKVRERFDNDPRKFLEFTGDARNREELGEMGLLNAEAWEAVQREREARLDQQAEQRVAKKKEKAEPKKD